MLTFLISVADNRTVTAFACTVLARHGLIRAWAVSQAGAAGTSVATYTTGESKISGLFEVDEAALNRLPGKALQEIALSGGLQLAYCQLISKLHLPALVQQVQERARSALSVQPVLPTPAENLDLAYLRQADTISFANLF